MLKQLGVSGFMGVGAIFLAGVLGTVVGASPLNNPHNTAPTTVTVSKPTTTVGDILIADISFLGGTPLQVTPPSGWTLIKRTNNDSTVSIASYWKVVNALEPLTYNWTINPSTYALGKIAAYSKISSTTPIETVVDATGKGIVAAAPSVATQDPNENVVVLYAADGGTRNHPVFEAPVGTNEIFNGKETPFGPTMAGFDMVKTIAGATNPFISTFSKGVKYNWAAQTIVLNSIQARKIKVQAWGAGGGSNGRGASGDGGVGGPGGAYSQLNAFAVTSKTIYTITVGTGGAAGTALITPGGAGGDTWFVSPSVLLAKGAGGAAGSGGQASLGVGDIKTSGGAGGQGSAVAGDQGAGGGGSGGDTTNGGNGGPTTIGGGVGGTAGMTNGTAGSPGAASSTSNGINGVQPGGGAGGAGNAGGFGGKGGNGRVVILAPIGTIASSTGGVHTQNGGYDIWTFNSSGTWIPEF
jgi:hypothetical protein